MLLLGGFLEWDGFGLAKRRASYRRTRHVRPSEMLVHGLEPLLRDAEPRVHLLHVRVIHTGTLRMPVSRRQPEGDVPRPQPIDDGTIVGRTIRFTTMLRLSPMEGQGLEPRNPTSTISSF